MLTQAGKPRCSSFVAPRSMALAFCASPSASAADYDWSAVAKALGRSGSEMPGGVYRVGLGRSDLKVTLDGVPIRPPWPSVVPRVPVDGLRWHGDG